MLGYFPEIAQDLLIYGLCGFLIIITITIAAIKNLFSQIALLSAFSLILTAMYSFLDAPDVAMTEAAINASIGTIFFLAAVIKGNFELKTSKSLSIIAIIPCLFLGCIMIYGIKDLYNFSDPNSPVFGENYTYYIQNTKYDIGIPSMVTAILASYRGFDTLGETMVIFIAGIIVSMILKKKELKENA